MNIHFNVLRIACIVAFLTVWRGTALAYLDVVPTVNPVQIQAGGSYAGKISVRNVSGEPLEVTLKTMDWKYDKPNGAKKFLPAGSSEFSCSRWISYSPVKLHLTPNQTADVRYSITVPGDAAGGYYSMILFAAMHDRNREAKEGVNVKISMEMSSLILVEIEKTQKVRGVVKELEALDPKVDRPFDIKVRFRNEGNVRIEAKGRVAITDGNGNAIGWTKFPDIKTLPGNDWTVTASWNGPLSAGRYHMVATFELSDGGILVEEKDLEIR